MALSRSPRTVWAYAYRIVAPQKPSRLRVVGALLGQQHSASRRGPRAWAGRLIIGAQMTRILIVSRSLERGRAVSRRLEAELHRLDVDFAVTEPMELPCEAASPSP
jgi:hypothetical protein